MEPTEPKKEIYLGTRPLSSLSDSEKHRLYSATRALLDWIWENREMIERVAKEREEAGWTPPPEPQLYIKPE